MRGTRWSLGLHVVGVCNACRFRLHDRSLSLSLPAARMSVCCEIRQETFLFVCLCYSIIIIIITEGYFYWLHIWWRWWQFEHWIAGSNPSLDMMSAFLSVIFL